jgi:hypothetical protein
MRATERTIRYFKDQGMTVDMVERWIPNPKHPGGGFRKDYLGCIDAIALCPEKGIIGVQSCGQDFAGHLSKIKLEKRTEALRWLQCGGKLVLIGWRKIKEKPRQGKRMVWSPRIHWFTPEDFSLN